MRILLVMVALSSTAVADRVALPALDLRTIPDACRAAATEPVSAHTIGPRLAAYTSAANCMAMIRLRALQLGPTGASVDAINQAIAPSIELLDAVIQNGDTQSQIDAQFAMADLYSGAGVALLASVPEPRTLTRPAFAIRDAMLGDALALIQPWRDRARASFREVVRLGTMDPQLAAKDPVIAFEVRVSRASQVSGIATR